MTKINLMVSIIVHMAGNKLLNNNCHQTGINIRKEGCLC